MDGDGTVVEGLGISIAKNETDIVDSLTVHVVDGIAAATTNTDNLNYAVALFIVGTEVKDIVILIIVCHSL